MDESEVEVLIKKEIELLLEADAISRRLIDGNARKTACYYGKLWTAYGHIGKALREIQEFERIKDSNPLIHYAE